MKARPPLETASIYLLMAFIGLVLADLSVMIARGHFYPTAPPPARPILQAPRLIGGNYGVITSRDIFNSDGKIPPAIGAGSNNPNEPEGPPVPSQLPIQLMGTIVHANPMRSVASVSLRGKPDQVPVRVGDVIPDNLAVVRKIERTKIIFRNNASQRLEYIEMKDEGKILFGAAQSVAKPVQNGEVTKMDDHDYSISRKDIDKLTNNLPQLLQQARAVPRFGPDGQIQCFSLADIASGSIYERLGLKQGDCIKAVNGEKIDSPAKAMELYNALRANSDNIQLGIERNGSDDNLNFSITQ